MVNSFHKVKLQSFTYIHQKVLGKIWTLLNINGIITIIQITLPIIHIIYKHSLITQMVHILRLLEMQTNIFFVILITKVKLILSIVDSLSMNTMEWELIIPKPAILSQTFGSMIIGWLDTCPKHIQKINQMDFLNIPILIGGKL